MRYSNILEEELKNKVAQDFFGKFDCTGIIKKIDFSVQFKEDNIFRDKYLLWAEAKKGSRDIYEMLAQLVLTIGKERPFNQHLPPHFLGCFDYGNIVFIPYSEIQEIFYQSDFNWNVTSSNRDTREFKHIQEQLNKIEKDKIYIFDFEKDESDLRKFIKQNFVVGQGETSKIRIDKNNFIIVYGKWLEMVKPTIGLSNWDKAKTIGIIDCDFYLADLLSHDNWSFKDKLLVMLRRTMYEMDRHEDEIGMFKYSTAEFKDDQKAHTQFWAKYERPPKEEYWDYIVERRDLLVPQDVRERKGAFFTPQMWVELSQRYIADVLGTNWQDEYYVWDCAAGTGNLLAGLTNKYNIWASTLDKADVKVMHDRIENGANLLKDHCFQFDFLNDDFSELPPELQNIINDDKKREKLIIYINPPYAEATTTATRTGTRENKTGVAIGNKMHTKYSNELGKASNELFALFLIRIYKELHGCKIANFSKLKALCASNFADFRNIFCAKLKKIFIVPANTFDNVKGQFPIGFHIWDTAQKEKFKRIKADIFNAKGIFCGKKIFCEEAESQYINDWIKNYKDTMNIINAKLCYVGNDFQNNMKVQICSQDKKIIAHDIVFNITQTNIIVACIYCAVRVIIPANWLNDRDRFLFPKDDWKKDKEFQNDCLAFIIFHGQNKIQSKYGINYWIPFYEKEVNAREKFANNFLADFINGKLKQTNGQTEIFGEKKLREASLQFSPEAQAVFEAGKKLWKYYHAQPKCNVNASFYDIREYFQGRNAKGTMNSKSEDAKYNELIGDLRSALVVLAKKIEPKVYEYGFLKG
jgi:hypothetical protein